MNEPLQVNEFSVSAAINKERASAVRFTRYNPWQLGLYVTGSLAVPVVAVIVSYQLVGWLGLLAALFALPVPLFVILWAVDALMVEHQRLIAERLQLKRAGEVHTPQLPTPEPAMVATRRHLRLGYSQDGRIVPPAAPTDPAMDRLRALCLKLVKLGAPADNWARSALAEGPGAGMRGEEWDAASVELQDLDLFIVKAGRGGGLRPKPGRELADIVARLEVAR